MLRMDNEAWSRIMTAVRRQGIALEPWLALDDATAATAQQYPTPQPGRRLIATRSLPMDYLVGDILHEGLTILAGKPKKGKSYFALDMSLAMAVGRLAFRRFPTKQQRVLYISLEDGERRLQTRLLKIQPNLTHPGGLDFLYAFPKLGAGALRSLDALRHDVWLHHC